MNRLLTATALGLILVLLVGCRVQSAPAAPTGNVVTMGPNNFLVASMTIKQGQTITFTDDKTTGSEHILVIGLRGVAQTEQGAPDFKGSGGITFQPGQSWTSPVWNTPGTYHVTCTIHPTTMNLPVTVTGSAPSSGSPTPAASSSSSSGQSASGNTALYTVAETTIRQFSLPHANSGLMRPAVDAQGDIWFGEMTGNRLGRLDPHTGQIEEWRVPHADYGLMGIVIDAENHVWFAEQNAGYIGEFFPTTQTFKVYPTTPRARDGGPSGPNDLVFDQQGHLWFTELGADRIGRLDVTTGQLKEYPLPGATPVAPYGVTVDHQGKVWFSEVSGPWLVRLDPQTGAMQRYTLPGASSGLMEVVTASDGSIWGAAYLNGTLDQLNPTTGAIHEYRMPALRAGSSATGIYGLAPGTAGTVWFTDIGDNAIGAAHPATGTFTFYPIPTADSGPFGLTIDQARQVWFTEGSAAGNAIGLVPATTAS